MGAGENPGVMAGQNRFDRHYELGTRVRIPTKHPSADLTAAHIPNPQRSIEAPHDPHPQNPEANPGSLLAFPYSNHHLRRSAGVRRTLTSTLVSPTSPAPAST